jgi:hypothetical protein
MIQKSVILVLIVLISFFIYLNLKKTYDNINNMPVTLETVYALQKESSKLYPKVKLNNLFNKLPKRVRGLNFGYICPGAMKTVDYLNEIVKSKPTPELKKIVRQIQILTDFQFFVEIYQIYREYLSQEVAREMMKLIKNNGCKISKTITDEISRLFGELPPKIKENLPDNFYHIRHNTLVCSKNKKLAKERIDLLKSIYGTKEDFNNQYHACLGKRNGVSGCRDCCNHHFSNNVSGCVRACMDF